MDVVPLLRARELRLLTPFPFADISELLMEAQLKRKEDVMSKVNNALKSIVIVAGFIAAIGLIALLVAMFKVAKNVALALLAVILPIMLIFMAVYLVYRYLESK